jgi:TPP-dependent indolepyruvate ferredoxin oxidoreductase alpha subunit
MQTKNSIHIDNQCILMRNEALGRGIIEAGVTLAASYPGTPASGRISPLF